MEKTRPETRNEPFPHRSEMHLSVDIRKKWGTGMLLKGGGGLQKERMCGWL